MDDVSIDGCFAVDDYGCEVVADELFEFVELCLYGLEVRIAIVDDFVTNLLENSTEIVDLGIIFVVEYDGL